MKALTSLRARTDRVLRTPRRRKMAGVTAATLALAMIVWAGARGWAAVSTADQYTTAVATRATITQTLSGSGTVVKTDQESATFPASGTVTGVNVSLGDDVYESTVAARLEDARRQLINL